MPTRPLEIQFKVSLELKSSFFYEEHLKIQTNMKTTVEKALFMNKERMDYSEIILEGKIS